ncbi:tubulin, gamma complex associated protein 3 [Phlyctochytrium arcticum]|nr:tubulin, gamma complex associated protein 3 [Phlyctochytrium arcticum]
MLGQGLRRASVITSNYSRALPTNLDDAMVATDGGVERTEGSVPHTLFLLVQKILREGQADGDPLRQKLQVERAYQYSVRILRSHLEAAVVADEANLVDSIKRKLVKRDKSSDCAIRFSNLHQKLLNLGYLKNTWATIYLLYTIGEHNQSSRARQLEDDNTLFAAGLERLPHNKSTPASSSQSAAGPSNRPIEKTKRHVTSPYQEAWKRDSPNIAEKDWLRDIIFVFQGIDGKYIRHDPRAEGYFIDPDVVISSRLRELLLRLAEVGWLYKRTTTYLKVVTSQKNAGMIAQSFASALQRELTDYYRLIAVLQSHCSADTNEKEGTTAPQLTLKRLLVWTMDPLQRLRIMSVLVDLCAGDRGGALLTTLNEYSYHGDPFVQQFTHHLLTEVSKPFYIMLRRWIYEGELDDPFEEFFVVGHTISDNDDFWEKSYSMRDGMVPSFIDSILAKKIFMVGKNLNFLRARCDDTAFVIQRSRDGQSVEVFDLNSTEAFRTTIDRAYRDTSQKVMDVMLDKYKLMEHLEAVRRYLFLGQGDLIQYLVDEIGVSLTKPASTLYRHNLNSSLETGIRMSNAQYDNQDILRRLDVRMMEISPGDTGWDVFSLIYQVESPLDTVFNETALFMCRRISNFLWKLKRVEHALSSTWKPRMRLPQVLRETSVYPVLHSCLLTWAEMNHFVTQMQYYVLFEVLECSWRDLRSVIDKKPDMDLLIKAHLQYLGTIISKSMLTVRSAKDEPPTIFKILDIILQFRTTQEQLHKYGARLARRDQSARLEFRERSFDISHIQDTSLHFGSDDDDENNEAVLDELRREMDTGAQKFEKEVATLMKLLAEQSDETLRTLSVRLSFNQYYANAK